MKSEEEAVEISVMKASRGLPKNASAMFILLESLMVPVCFGHNFNLFTLVNEQEFDHGESIFGFVDLVLPDTPYNTNWVQIEQISSEDLLSTNEIT